MRNALPPLIEGDTHGWKSAEEIEAQAALVGCLCGVGLLVVVVAVVVALAWGIA